MEVVGKADIHDAPIPFPAVRILADGQISHVDDAVQEESLLEVLVQGSSTIRIGCSTSHLVELVIGRLFTEGIISGIDDIVRISVDESPLRASVRLRSTMQASDPCLGAATSFCTTTNSPSTSRWLVEREKLEPVDPISWDPRWVLHMGEIFGMDHTMHKVTRGAHSAYLATMDKMICCREDIGRHNAFDKVIGHALLAHIDLRKCLVFTSGRVPTDMVTKAIRARLPLLVSKAVATDKTVALAREYDLTLVCSATASSLDVLNDPGSSACEPMVYQLGA